ncbi:hypothetical protein B6N25_08865 [Sphingobacteriales bacterium TSM_CSS]|nr:hypothetical protein B6N25_08865 [Sphingobacteriales bacterium TSM_CSS]
MNLDMGIYFVVLKLRRQKSPIFAAQVRQKTGWVYSKYAKRYLFAHLLAIFNPKQAGGKKRQF